MSKSIWSEETNFPERKSLNQNIAVDVAVVGAGLTGILTAYLLQKQGLKVVVIEANKVGGGITKNTTAKITSQHNLIYDKLISQFGEGKAAEYALANQMAIAEYSKIIVENKINCQFEFQPNYVYTLRDLRSIEREVTAAKRLGLPASFTTKTALPYPIKGAVRFEEQAQFQPLLFLKKISNKIKVYEGTQAVEFDNNLKVMVGKKKYIVKAKDTIITTHYPFINTPGYYFLKMHQERAYVIGIDSPKTMEYGMYIDENPEGYSLRRYQDFILLGSGSHRTGKNESGGKYKKLYAASKRWYPNSEIRYHWSNQDCITLDGVPYIGKYSSQTPHLYVATGFKKWGMTSAMVSATILRDQIGGLVNSQSIFNPQRFQISGSTKVFMEEVKTATTRLSLQLFSLPQNCTQFIKNGKGEVVSYQNHKVGVYKDEKGTVYAVSTKCPHMGCMLSWNPDELTWDCPCHGSRFSYKGQLIDNPALKGADNSCILNKKRKKQ